MVYKRRDLGRVSLYSFVGFTGAKMRLVAALLVLVLAQCHSYRIFPFKGDDESPREIPRHVHGRIKSLALDVLGHPDVGDVNLLPPEGPEISDPSIGEAWRLWASRMEPRNSLRNIPMFRRLANR